jgi:hypothetical protein
MPEGPVYDPGSNWQLPGPNGVPHAGSYGSQASGSGGTGYRYDEASLHELAREWNDLANEFARDLSYAIWLQRAQGPGAEYASGGNAELVRASGDALHATLTAREEYCRSMATKFQTALGKYATAEDTHTRDLNQTGGSL